MTNGLAVGNGNKKNHLKNLLLDKGVFYNGRTNQDSCYLS